MNVLLSVKPKYVEKIIEGTKKYEFRKLIFKTPDKSEKVYIYSSSPIKKIVGSFCVEDIIQDKPKNLWDLCGNYAGINEKDFFEYFKNKETGFAILMRNLEVFDEPIDPYENIENFRAPQSYSYIENDLIL